MNSLLGVVFIVLVGTTHTAEITFYFNLDTTARLNSWGVASLDSPVTTTFNYNSQFCAFEASNFTDFPQHLCFTFIINQDNTACGFSLHYTFTACIIDLSQMQYSSTNAYFVGSSYYVDNSNGLQLVPTLPSGVNVVYNSGYTKFIATCNTLNSQHTMIFNVLYNSN